MAPDYHQKSDYSSYSVMGYPVRHRMKDPFYPMLSLDLDIRGKIREIHDLDSILGGYVYPSRITTIWSWRRIHRTFIGPPRSKATG